MPPMPNARTGPKTGSCVIPIITSAVPDRIGWTGLEPLADLPERRADLRRTFETELDPAGLRLMDDLGGSQLDRHRIADLPGELDRLLGAGRDPALGDGQTGRLENGARFGDREPPSATLPRRTLADAPRAFQILVLEFGERTRLRRPPTCICSDLAHHLADHFGEPIHRNPAAVADGNRVDLALGAYDGGKHRLAGARRFPRGPHPLPDRPLHG